MDTRDSIQLIIWAVFGLFITWGIFLAYIGFRNVPAYSKRRLARTSAVITLVVGVAWVMIWVSAVVFNLIQILGGLPNYGG